MTKKSHTANDKPSKKSNRSKAVKAAERYVVYVHETKNAQEAEKINTELKAAGYLSQIFKNKKDKRLHYRVGIANFETRKHARSFANRIEKELNFKNIQVEAMK